MATLKTSPKSVSLTAPQVLALASAARRDDGALALPARLKGRAAQNFVDALIEKGLARELRAKPDMPVCRRDAETGGSYALIITRLGRASIAAGLPEGSSQDIAPSTALVASPMGAHQGLTHVHAAALVPAGERGRPEPHASMPRSEPLPADGAKGNNAPRQGSKLAGVIALLSCEAGVCIEELMASTGWLPHTTRAALTGLRKRGYVVLREHRAGKGSVYRIEPVSCAKAA